MAKKTNRWKHAGALIIMALFILCVSLFFLQMDIEEDRIIDAYMEVQMQNLECGESFSVTENTHHSVIKRTEKILKNSEADKDSVLIGKSNYKFIGASYNWDGKFVWQVEKNDSTYLEILIENQDLGLNIARCMTIYLICE